MIFHVYEQLHKKGNVSISIYCCAFGHPFDQYRTRKVKKEYQHRFSSWCFWPYFRRVWWIFVLPCQWRLLTGWYVIMASRFIACNYAVENHVPFVLKASKIFFASGNIGSTWFGSQHNAVPSKLIFFSISVFL